jgi:hypothetical protein
MTRMISNQYMFDRCLMVLTFVSGMTIEVNLQDVSENVIMTVATRAHTLRLLGRLKPFPQYSHSYFEDIFAGSRSSGYPIPTPIGADELGIGWLKRATGVRSLSSAIFRDCTFVEMLRGRSDISETE